MSKQERISIISLLKTHKNEWFLFALALGLRTIFYLHLKENYPFYEHPASDVLYYQAWAQEISRVSFIGTKVFWGLPLYPYFLALLDRLTLGNLFLIRMFHLILGSFNCVLIYGLGQKIFSKKIALLAAILVATNFTLIYYDWIMMPVPLLIFLTLVILISLTHLHKKQSPRQLFILGLFLGLAILGDGKMLIFSAIIFLTQIKNIISKKDFILIKKTAYIAIGILSILGITILRNKIVSGDSIFISAQSGLSFYVGNNETATGYFQNPDFIRPTHYGQDVDQQIVAEMLTGETMSPRQVSQFWRRKGVSFIFHSPKVYGNLLLKKIRLFFSENENTFDIDLLMLRNFKEKFDLNPYGWIFPLALLGMFFSGRVSRRKGGFYLNAIILSQLLLVLIFFLTNRHRATILPILILYESYTLVWICDQLRKYNIGPLLLIISSIFGFSFIFPRVKANPKLIKFLHHSKIGPILEEKGDYAKALYHYKKALVLRPYDTNTLYNMSNTYFLSGDYEKAIQIYKQILAINPIHIDALFNLAFTYEQIGKFSQAQIIYQNLLKIDAQNRTILHYRLGEIYRQQARYSLSRFHFQKVMDLNPAYKNEMLLKIENYPAP